MANVTEPVVVPDEKINDDTKRALERIMNPNAADKQNEQPEEPPMWRVILHNDHSTLPDFVMMVLMEAFKVQGAKARGIMMTAHRSGQCFVLVDTKERVETMMGIADNLISRARPGRDCVADQCELRFSMEEEPSGKDKK